METFEISNPLIDWASVDPWLMLFGAALYVSMCMYLLLKLLPKVDDRDADN